MKKPLGLFVLFLMVFLAAGPFRAAGRVPRWAYPVNLSSEDSAPADRGGRRVPDSTAAFTPTQLRDSFNVPDWRPTAHPPMPTVVGHGRKPALRACGYCHLPNGFGRPESASLAGLPSAYIAEQMANYRKGLRRSAEPQMGPAASMVAVARAADTVEAQAAADYFASIAAARWIRVVEASVVPKTRVSGGMFVPVDNGATEPIGVRVVEVPEHRERAELRDPASGFVAYAPIGSLQRGGQLVTTGGAGKTVRCALCHGAQLKGMGLVPAIAGRSPSYLARQLFDMQQGTRRGAGPDLMMGTVARLTEDDLVAIVAYTASLAP